MSNAAGRIIAVREDGDHITGANIEVTIRLSPLQWRRIQHALFKSVLILDEQAAEGYWKRLPSIERMKGILSDPEATR